MAPRTLKVVSGAKVAICIPCGNTVTAEFMYDLSQLCTNTAVTLAAEGVIDFCVVMVQSSLLDRSRCDLIDLARKQDATHVLFLDSDMRFPWDTLVRLLGHNVGIAAANYSTRSAEQCKPVSYKKGALATLDDPSVTDSMRRLWPEPTEMSLVEADAVGMGACLIRMDVLNAFGDTPPFQTRYDPATKRWVGEDVFFCQRARELGYPIWVDPDLSDEIEHVGVMSFTLGMTSLVKAQHEEQSRGHR